VSSAPTWSLSQRPCRRVFVGILLSETLSKWVIFNGTSTKCFDKVRQVSCANPGVKVPQAWREAARIQERKVLDGKV
jgi:hypothetical protein